MYSKCGDVIQQWQKYLPKTKAQSKEKGVWACLKGILQNELKDLRCDCPISCNEMYIESKVDLKECNGIKVDFEYLSGTYTEIVELPAYPASKFITDIGGWLSLFSGMSALSLLELVIFTPLATITVCKKIKNLRRIDTHNALKQ